jgi:tetratricopeptide (TPR) repeat protein
MDAQALYKKGLELKSQGKFDLALTEFRRAVLSDATLAAAHFEIGLLCKEKAKLEPIFQRHTFEAFRNAARLDKSNAEAHNQYILSGQKMGVLEDLMEEYKRLTQAHPNDELLQRNLKTIFALTMAMMPDRVSLDSSKASAGLKKMVFFLAMGLFVLSGALMLAPLFFQRSKKLEPQTATVLFRTGLATGALGVGAFIVLTRLK